jgi:hypothetical protein
MIFINTVITITLKQFDHEPQIVVVLEDIFNSIFPFPIPENVLWKYKIVWRSLSSGIWSHVHCCRSVATKVSYVYRFVLTYQSIVSHTREDRNLHQIQCENIDFALCRPIWKGRLLLVASADLKGLESSKQSCRVPYLSYNNEGPEYHISFR